MVDMKTVTAPSAWWVVEKSDTVVQKRHTTASEYSTVEYNIPESCDVKEVGASDIGEMSTDTSVLTDSEKDALGV